MNESPSSAETGDAAPAAVTVSIEISSNAPQDLLDRVTAMAQDLDGAGIEVTLDMIRICRVCGCTDDRACLGGCSWLDDQDDICSTCGPVVPDVATLFTEQELHEAFAAATTRLRDASGMTLVIDETPLLLSARGKAEYLQRVLHLAGMDDLAARLGLDDYPAQLMMVIEDEYHPIRADSTASEMLTRLIKSGRKWPSYSTSPLRLPLVPHTVENLGLSPEPPSGEESDS